MLDPVPTDDVFSLLQQRPALTHYPEWVPEVEEVEEWDRPHRIDWT